MASTDKSNIDLQSWLLYSKDGTLQGDYVLMNKGLMDCPEESYLLTWDGCGSTAASLGTFSDNSVWRIRPRNGQKYKYENISSKDKKCLAKSNYLDIGGAVTADYFSSGDFKGVFEPELFKPKFTTALWSLEHNERKFLTARDCDSKNFMFADE